jgi:hypothetical protein
MLALHHLHDLHISITLLISIQVAGRLDQMPLSLLAR